MVKIHTAWDLIFINIIDLTALTHGWEQNLNQIKLDDDDYFSFMAESNS